MWCELDVRDLPPSIPVPTLVLHRSEEIFPVEAARQMASMIPGARLVVLPGIDHLPWAGDADAYIDEIEEFLTGARKRGHSDRVLRTVLVTSSAPPSGRARSATPPGAPLLRVTTT